MIGVGKVSYIQLTLRIPKAVHYAMKILFLMRKLNSLVKNCLGIMCVCVGAGEGGLKAKTVFSGIS